MKTEEKIREAAKAYANRGAYFNTNDYSEGIRDYGESSFIAGANWAISEAFRRREIEKELPEARVDGKPYTWRPLEWKLWQKGNEMTDTVFGTYDIYWNRDAFKAHTPDLRVLGRYPTPDEAKKACENDLRKSVIDEFFNEEK